jgi:formyl-CoA transferase
MLQKQQQAALAANRPLKLRMQVRSFDAVCHMVASGLGVAILPKGATLPIIKSMKLGWRPLADAWASAACWRPPWPASPMRPSPRWWTSWWRLPKAPCLRKTRKPGPQSGNGRGGPRAAHCRPWPPLNNPFPPLPLQGPLAGLKVLELGQLIAGPFAAKTLADFGADIIKIETPGAGDPLRKWRLLKDGTSVWWQVQSRNKRSVALDLKSPEAQDIVRRLALDADVLIENFRPGAMEGWGLGPDELLALNPRLIMLRISGYGQTGPYRDKPGFGVVAEAMSGLRHLTAEPGRVPVRVGVSIGDTLAALHGVIGILLAMQERQRSGKGQVIDVALYEAVFNCMESLLPEYSAFGAVRGAAGSALPGIAPSNAYLCKDGGYALVAGNGDSIFKRLMATIGRADLGSDPALADNAGRVARVEEIDAAIGQWTLGLTVDEVLAALDKVSVPAGRIYTVADIAADPHYQARGMLDEVRMDDGSLLAVPGIVPKLSRTPGGHRRNAPQIGQDTDAVLSEMGLSPAADPGAQGQRHRGREGRGRTMKKRIFSMRSPRATASRSSPISSPTDDKVALVDALSECGYAKIEVTSFTSPKAIPMLRDAEEVMGRIRRVPGVEYTVLVPNLRGAERALESRADELNLVMSVSETHNLANLRMPREKSFAALSDVVRHVGGRTPINVSLSCCFGCPMEGEVPEEEVLRWSERFAAFGADRVRGLTICDTTGMAHPAQVAAWSSCCSSAFRTCS